MSKMELAIADHRHQLCEGDVVTLTCRDGEYTTRYRLSIGEHGGLEIDGDVLDEVGASKCEGIYIQPMDKYTVTVWTL